MLYILYTLHMIIIIMHITCAIYRALDNLGIAHHYVIDSQTTYSRLFKTKFDNICMKVVTQLTDDFSKRSLVYKNPLGKSGYFFITSRFQS